MVVGDRLRQLREQKNLSQGHIEERTGLLRCYISRVENGHTIPAIETLEKFARALETPMYQLLYDGEGIPKAPPQTETQSCRRGPPGAVRARMPPCWRSSVASLAACKKRTAACSSTSPRKCTKRPPDQRVAVPSVAQRSRGTPSDADAVTRPRTGAFCSYFASPLRYSISFCWSAGVSFAP